jgi:hypothetical protein
MIAIQTKYLPHTETLPSRIVAWKHNGPRLTVSVHQTELADLNVEQSHAYVASKLAYDFNWYTATNYLIGGEVAEGYVFVFSDSNIIAPKYGVEP